jgi:hypothetical protein
MEVLVGRYTPPTEGRFAGRLFAAAKMGVGVRVGTMYIVMYSCQEPEVV